MRPKRLMLMPSVSHLCLWRVRLGWYSERSGALLSINPWSSVPNSLSKSVSASRISIMPCAGIAICDRCLDNGVVMDTWPQINYSSLMYQGMSLTVTSHTHYQTCKHDLWHRALTILCLSCLRIVSKWVNIFSNLFTIG